MQAIAQFKVLTRHFHGKIEKKRTEIIIVVANFSAKLTRNLSRMT